MALGPDPMKIHTTPAARSTSAPAASAPAPHESVTLGGHSTASIPSAADIARAWRSEDAHDALSATASVPASPAGEIHLRQEAPKTAGSGTWVPCTFINDGCGTGSTFIPCTDTVCHGPDGS